MSTFKSNTLLRFSRFLHIVNLENGMVAFYNALSQAVSYVSSDVGLAIQNIVKPFTLNDLFEMLRPAEKKDLRAFLKQLWMNKMLMEPKEDEMVDVEELKRHLSQPDIAIMYLLVTDACNIACGYCYFEGGIPEGYKFSLMTEEVARQNVDLFARVYARDLLNKEKEGPHIVFYGGEPLMNWPVVEATLKYIHKLIEKRILPKNTQITLNTNGILITPEIATVLIKYKVNIAISLDGPECLNDKMRFDHQGQGTFSRVMPVIQMLQKMGANVGTCCTIDNHNIDQMEEVTRWMIEDMGFNSLGFNTLLESTARPIPNAEQYGEKVAQKLVDCFQIARAHGVHEDRFMRKVKAFEKGDFFFADCGGCGMQIAVAPNGEIGTCQGFCGTREFFVKPGPDFDPRIHPYWQEWRRRSPINMEQCLDCVALANCGGGCPHNAAIKSGSIWELDKVFCKHSIYAVEFLIKDLYEQHTAETVQ
jgi:uncharacterized protein